MKKIILNLLAATAFHAQSMDLFWGEEWAPVDLRNYMDPEPYVPVISKNWKIENITFDTLFRPVGKVEIRAGYFAESQTARFRGNILYLEGLGDSMLNHETFFQALSDQGYRVIAFDYMGQGGSGGHMNNTRIATLSPRAQGLEIRNLAKHVWRRYAREDNNKKLLLGWSTGGLVAYQMAHDGWADAVALIAPGLDPKYFVGDFFSITEANLACMNYPLGENPHKDPVKPNSALDVIGFGANLIAVAKVASFWKIPRSLPGMHILAGDKDKFVDWRGTKQVFYDGAPHFEEVTDLDACHELHNSVNAGWVQRTIIDFFNRTTASFTK